MQNVPRNTRRFFRLAMAAALLAAGGPAVVHAGETPDAAASSFLTGAGAALGPRYSGADQNAVTPVLLLDYSSASGWFASTKRGLGYGGQAGAFSYGAALGYRPARKESDQHGVSGNTGSDRLRGMGDIAGGANATLNVGYALSPAFELGVSADVPLAQKDNGKNLHLSLASQLYSGPADKLSLDLAAGFADSKYAQTYYGVTGLQAARSRFGAYQAGAGLYEASAALTWSHQLTARLNLTSALGVTSLLKDAGRSPLTERKHAPTAAVYAAYSY